jgi:indole-3-glycerol phosphate synthase
VYLQKIVDYKKQELEHRRRGLSLKEARKKAEDTEPARNFLKSLQQPGIRIIAEVKKSSPSAGVISPDFDPIRTAMTYEENGAACLSVLTDEHFFEGSLAYLEDIRKRSTLPVLRKDFTLDAYHVYEARLHGADAILLIVRILEDAQIRDYTALAKDLGMTALIEVHDDVEMDRAVAADTKLIGINNRNLDTLQIDLETSVRLSKKAPKDAHLVSESGLSEPDHLRKLQDYGFRSFLIGEAFMRAKDPGRKLKEMISQ